MPTEQKDKAPEKENLHPRNLHRGSYNFAQLVKVLPELRKFVSLNKYQIETIDFTNADAVKILNRALLKTYYNINHWDIPDGFLCPPIPGRADYIHYLADLLAESNGGTFPPGKQVNILDVGIGANAIYPILGVRSYGWQFVGSDIDPVAIESANKIISSNKNLVGKVEARLQSKSGIIFTGIVKSTEVFDATICNPPFHASLKEAQAGTLTKWRNLGKEQKAMLNFGGQKAELWTAGGETAFISRMIEQSSLIPDSCFWFTTLVSKKDSLEAIYRTLHWFKAVDVRTINMSQGQKVSRMVAWTFLDEAKQQAWKAKRWAAAEL
jgi:23S rRNA (adenine1618-N6)-methyltransferase